LGAASQSITDVAATAVNNIHHVSENEMKKSLGGDEHCVLAVVRRSQKFSPAADPFLGARDGQNLTSWRWSLPLPKNPVW